MASGRRTSKGSRRGGVGVSARARTVWGALLAAMTLVGGGLLALDRKSAAAADGLSLPPLVATTGPDTVDTVFRTTAPLDATRWKAIVIHDSGTLSASPETLENDAKRLGLRGMGFHFVVGNGKGMADGELLVGARWLNQAAGAHTAGPSSDWYNRNAIGICLAGDGSRRPFTPAQMKRLVQLVDALCREFKIPPDKVFLHSQLSQTPSPGKLFPEAAFRVQLGGAR